RMVSSYMMTPLMNSSVKSAGEVRRAGIAEFEPNIGEPDVPVAHQLEGQFSSDAVKRREYRAIVAESPRFRYHLVATRSATFGSSSVHRRMPSDVARDTISVDRVRLLR